METKPRGRKPLDKVGMWVYIPRVLYNEIEKKRGAMVRSNYVALLIKKGLEQVPEIPV